MDYCPSSQVLVEFRIPHFFISVPQWFHFKIYSVMCWAKGRNVKMKERKNWRTEGEKEKWWWTWQKEILYHRISSNYTWLENVNFICPVCTRPVVFSLSSEASSHIYNLQICLPFASAEGMACLCMQLSSVQGFPNWKCITQSNMQEW